MSKKAGNKGRKKGSDKRKNTFKKYGKNTTRGLRIKQTEKENKAKPNTTKGNHPITVKNYTGQVGGKGAKKMCKTTCHNKKYGK